MRSALVPALLALTLAGCSPAPAPAPPPATSSAAPVDDFGDRLTIDWCSLLDPELLAGFGDFDTARPAGFESCYSVAPVDAEPLIEVSIGIPSPGSEDRRGRAVDGGGGTTISPLDGEPGECARHVNFPGTAIVEVSAVASADAPAHARACDMVDTIVAAAREVLAAGELAHHRTGGHTIRGVDPCAVAPAELVRAEPLLADAVPRIVPLSHTCRWRSAGVGGGGPMVTVTLAEDSTTSEQFREEVLVDGEPLSVAVSSVDCTAVIPVRQTPDGLVEVVSISYTADLDPQARCAAAGRIARAAARGLAG
ncbi:DUF3558 family protein [Actinokineospora sp. G85]|uniref:DUF3558 family protein n=1 Tax=Actinokineospora sp. G85 TaxID=3406626 RepID=UPI003C738F5D